MGRIKKSVHSIVIAICLFLGIVVFSWDVINALHFAFSRSGSVNSYEFVTRGIERNQSFESVTKQLDKVGGKNMSPGLYRVVSGPDNGLIATYVFAYGLKRFFSFAKGGTECLEVYFDEQKRAVRVERAFMSAQLLFWADSSCGYDLVSEKENSDHLSVQ